ncbi:MAG: Photosystem II manganese-stabilizing polypeptide, partial [Moorea sp. SIO4G2]|nr:Photosystem II manganese-stabilizing polypeptide [Moorena sp. SIO4G2]NEO67931.1 Photosystem II manganese-stabilizing polypeptide [Moorena sp. SIO4G2]
FISEQPSDTDLGADEPEEVKVQGIFYARIQPKQA